MTATADVKDALAQLDRRERSTRYVTMAMTAVLLLVAAGALFFLFSQIALSTSKLAGVQRELSENQGLLEQSRAKVAAFERQKADLAAQTAEVQRQYELLSADKKKLVEEIDLLRAEKARLVEQTKLYESDRTQVRKSLARLADDQQSPLGKTVSAAVRITAVVAPRASASKLAGSGDRYRFRVWLDVPEARRAEVASVQYLFDHPTFAQKTMSSSNPGDGFAVEYQGWGALTHVVIEIRLKNGETEKMPFNMLAALGWE